MQSKLDHRRSSATLRSLSTVRAPCQPEIQYRGRELVNFSSNDYLGLANHPSLIEATVLAARQYGVGAGASPLITGYHTLHEQLGARLAELTGRESAMVLGCGFSANKLLLQTLTTKEDVIFQDRLNHASLIDGARYSEAKMVRYKHNDVDDLAGLLERKGARSAEGRNFIVSDSVFSMDGDIAPVKALSDLAGTHNGLLMLDDAHGFGVLGESGGGIAEEASLDQASLPILMGTLGKALGSYGAFIAGSKTLIDTLINFGRSYIYSTATPPALAAATLAALEIVQTQPERRAQLLKNIERFKAGLSELGITHTDSATPIQVLTVGDNEMALRWQQKLEQRGFLVAAIRPPTVPVNTARLRFAISAAHRVTQIDGLLAAIAEVHGELNESDPARLAQS